MNTEVENLGNIKENGCDVMKRIHMSTREGERWSRMVAIALPLAALLVHPTGVAQASSAAVDLTRSYSNVAPTQEVDPPGGTYEEGYGLGSQEGHLSGTRDCASLPAGWRPRGWGERASDLSEYRKGYSDAYEKAYNEVCP